MAAMSILFDSGFMVWPTVMVVQCIGKILTTGVFVMEKPDLIISFELLHENL